MSLELRQWDVVKVRINPTDRDEHPAIILSADEIAGGRADRVNILYGSTKRPAMPQLKAKSYWMKPRAVAAAG